MGGEWACPVCTLRNARSAGECEACGTLAPHLAFSPEEKRKDGVDEREAESLELALRLQREEEEAAAAQATDHSDRDSESDLETSHRSPPARKVPKASRLKSSNAAPAPLSEYELKRLENIRKNEEQMKALGIGNLIKATTGSVPAPPKVKVSAPKKRRRFGETSSGDEESSGERDDDWEPERPAARAARETKSNSKTPKAVKSDFSTSKRTHQVISRSGSKANNGRKSSKAPSKKAKTKPQPLAPSQKKKYEFSLNDMKDAFKLIDKDNDGYITFGDLALSCTAIKKELSVEAIEDMLTYGNKDSRISRNDFLDVMCKITLCEDPNNKLVTL